jgi:hypothetical protein
MFALEFQPGERVRIVEPQIDGVVEFVTIGRGCIVYEIGFWKEGEQNSVTVHPEELVTLEDGSREKAVVTKKNK